MVDVKLPGMPRTPEELLAELIADSDNPTAEQTAQARLWLSWLTPKIEAEVMRREKVGVITLANGPEGCQPGEWDCDEYYDKDGDQLPGVERCSHITDDMWNAERLLELIEHVEQQKAEGDPADLARREVADEIRCLFVDPDRAGAWLETHGLGTGCGPGSVAFAIATEIERRSPRFGSEEGRDDRPGA
jgi:hypothetical protein